MVQKISEWLSHYQTSLAWLGLISLLMFVFSLLLLPWLIKGIPNDYFQRNPGSNHLGMLLSPLNLLRNVICLAILLAGLAMLILPGQGIITVLVGIAIMEFPGKYRLEHWLITRPGVLSAVNWIRRKTKSSELKV